MGMRTLGRCTIDKQEIQVLNDLQRASVMEAQITEVPGQVLGRNENGPDGIGLPGPRWQTEQENGLRLHVVEKILQFYKNRNPHVTPERQQKLPDFVKRLEQALYENAHSKEKYEDLKTLEPRVLSIARHIGSLRRVPNQPSCLAVSSSPMGNMVPLPDAHGKVFAVRELKASPLSECIQEISHGGSSSSGMEPSSERLNLVSGTPSVRADEHESSSNGLIPEHIVLHSDNKKTLESDYSLESQHKVFLSHSSDQKDFVEQLCVDLERCDRCSFFDKLRSSLPIGERFPKLIFDAIEQCWVGVVVLSEDFFTRSKWPMLELNAMVKEFEKLYPRITILPVFYLISLEALKDTENQSRWISQWNEWALEDKRINVEDWKRALRVLGSINGMVAKKGYGDVKFREEIVAEVCKVVPPETRWDDSHVQGRSRNCKFIREKMNEVSKSSRVCVMGLYGVGGIGKTTICKVLCNNLCIEFHDNVCHVELGSAKEMELLRKALKKLTDIRHTILDELNDIGQGYAYLKRKMRSGRIFLALDNVQDDHKAIEAAQTYLKASYGPGSVVMVTARSLNVLKELNLDESRCLEMPELEEDEARTLFLNHVDLPSGSEVDEVLVKDCLKRCHFLKGDGKRNSRHYHPLALKVLGQQLGCNTTRWAAQLRKMDTFNQLGDVEHPVFSILRNIFSILRNSFDSLKREHQLVFMDLALLVTSGWVWPNASARLEWLCYMHEETVEDMQNMLEVLKRKSLLEDLSDESVENGMHDLWREFAVAETKAQVFRDQRWVCQVDGKRALRKSGRGRESVERMCFVNKGWRGLKGLKLDDFVNVEAFHLRVVTLMADCELDLDLRGLRHLKSLFLWTPGLRVRVDGLNSLTNLAALTWRTPGFSPCLDGIGRLTNLQGLQLEDCEAVQVLDITELELLRLVLITNFPDLITVRGFNSRLANLRFLLVNSCKSLRECPGLGELYALETLELSNCGMLQELPCLGRLTNLRVLNIEECTSIRAVPGLSDLVALEEFYAMGCSGLAVLPDLVKLTNLRVLDIRDCPVEGLPGLDCLLGLTMLLASFCNVSNQQPIFSRLSALKSVWIFGWIGPIWTSIRNLLMLEELKLHNCEGENVVPDLQSLKRLEAVYIENCNFRDLSALSSLTALYFLGVYDCELLERLPEFERLTNLARLGIRGCRKLRHWQFSSNLCLVVDLLVDEFSLMKILPHLETLTGLQELALYESGCENALSTTSLSQLEMLRIFRFCRMETLDVSHFPQLKELVLSGCSALKRVTCNIPLTALTELEVEDCESLVEMPDLSTFPHLEELRLESCRSLRRLTCSRPVTAMKCITLLGCRSRVEMPDLSTNFPDLERFFKDDDEDEVVKGNEFL